MEKELAKLIYLSALSTMKATLDVEELRFDAGRSDPRYKTFKRLLMSTTYDNLRNLFADLADLGVIQETPEYEDVSEGYKATISGGSGFLNTPEFNGWIETQVKDTDQPEGD